MGHESMGPFTNHQWLFDFEEREFQNDRLISLNSWVIECAIRNHFGDFGSASCASQIESIISLSLLSTIDRWKYFRRNLIPMTIRVICPRRILHRRMHRLRTRPTVNMHLLLIFASLLQTKNSIIGAIYFLAHAMDIFTWKVSWSNTYGRTRSSNPMWNGLPHGDSELVPTTYWRVLHTKENFNQTLGANKKTILMKTSTMSLKDPHLMIISLGWVVLIQWW